MCCVLTLVLHQAVMHSQQNRCPQGVAVLCLRSSRHSVQRDWHPAATSLLVLLINTGTVGLIALTLLRNNTILKSKPRAQVLTLLMKVSNTKA